jgi:fibronectin-binding autotransporter adhesin
MALPCDGKRRNSPLGPQFRRRLSSWLALSTVLTLGTARPAKATNLYWDPDGNPANNVFTGGLYDGEGGAGTWDTSSSVWYNPSTGLEQVWNNANNDTAVFAGTISGVPTIQDGGITVGGLDFETGGMIFGGGPLTFGGTTANITLDWPVGETVTINSNLAGTATLNFTNGVLGRSVLSEVNLGGSGASFTGATIVSPGMTVSLTGALSTALSNTSSITLNNGTLTLDGNAVHVGASVPITSNGGVINYTNTGPAASYATTLGPLTAASGQTAVISTNGVSSGYTEVLTLSGISQSGTGTLDLGGGDGGLSPNTNVIAVAGITTSTPAGQIVAPWLTTGTFISVQTDYVAYSSNGTTATVTAANIAASAPTTWTNAAKAYTINANATAANPLVMTALRNSNQNNDITLTLKAGDNLETSGILNGGVGAFTIAPGTGGVVTLPSTTSGNLYLDAGNNQAPSIVISAPITNNGAGVLTLVVNGSGSTILSGTNLYTGPTVINSGILSIASGTNLGTGGSGGIIFGGNAMLEFTAATTLASTIPITLNNGAIATIYNNAYAVTLAGNITGPGGLEYGSSVSGTLTLSGTNTFTGPLVLIGNGTVQAGIANTAFGNNAVVDFDPNSGTTLNITGFNETIGSLSGGTPSGGNVILGAATLTVGGNNESTLYDGAISGTGNLIKNGSGILNLAGLTSSWSGTTTINSGTLAISSNTNLGASAVTLSGGTLAAVGTEAITDTNVITVGASGGTIYVADTLSGQLYLHTTNTLIGSGPLTVTGLGTLQNGIFGNLRSDVTQSYSGTMTLTSGGSFEYGVSGAVAAGATFVVGNQGELIVNGSSALSLPNAITVSGGTNSVLSFENGNSGAFSGPITLNANVVIGLRDWSNYANVRNGTISGAISGTGGLSLTSGTGTGGVLTVSNANNTYTGATSVTSGRLIVSGSLSGTSSVNVGGGTPASLTVDGSVGSATNAASVGVSNGGAINGTGNGTSTGVIYGGITAAGGTVSPGDPATNNGIGILTSKGLYIASNSTLSINIGSTVYSSQIAGTDYSQFVANGISLGSNITLSLQNPSFQVSPAATYLDIALNTSGSAVAGTFAGIAQGGTVTDTAGITWKVSYTAGGPGGQFIGGGNDIAIQYLVPEPNSWAILLGSLIVTLGLQRFRRRRA